MINLLISLFVIGLVLALSSFVLQAAFSIVLLSIGAIVTGFGWAIDKTKSIISHKGER